MALTSLGGIKAELDTVVKKATNLVDLVDKYAHVLRSIPGIGSTVGPELAALDELDKALHKVQSLLSSV